MPIWDTLSSRKREHNFPAAPQTIVLIPECSKTLLSVGSMSRSTPQHGRYYTAWGVTAMKNQSRHLTRFCWLKLLQSLNINPEYTKKIASLYFFSTSLEEKDFNICFDSMATCSSIIKYATQPGTWFANSPLGMYMQLTNPGCYFNSPEAWDFWNYYELHWYISSWFPSIIQCFLKWKSL